MESLEDLPRDLQESHKRSMERIRNQTARRRETALKALSLVYHAKGALTVESAQQALASRHGDNHLDKGDIDDDEMFYNMTAGLLATRSGCLVFVQWLFRRVIPNNLVAKPRQLSTRIDDLFAVHFLSRQYIYGIKVLLSRACSTDVNSRVNAIQEM